MAGNRDIILYHAPNTRSTGARVLLEELGVPYTLKVLNMKAEEQRQPAYLAINPMGKVPAVRHGDALITEQVAVSLYLADLFPEAGLAPALDDPARGPYLRWLVYYASCFEPAVVDRYLKHEPAPARMSPYGDFDTSLPRDLTCSASASARRTYCGAPRSAGRRRSSWCPSCR
jgi:glutathione S-transferase